MDDVLAKALEAKDLFHFGLELLMTAGLMYAGWSGGRVVKRLDTIERHETKLEVHESRLDGHDRDITRHENELIAVRRAR